jgi:hypothetical protein
VPFKSAIGNPQPEMSEPFEAYLRARLAVERVDRSGLGARVSFPPELQGPPDTAHGGGLTAMLLELVRAFLEAEGDPGLLDGPVSLAVRLHRPLPLDTEAAGEVRPADAGPGWHSRILLEGRPVAEADIRPAARGPELPDGLRGGPDAARRSGEPVPAYEWCLGCGLQNPRGAQVRFEYDEAWMWKAIRPQPHFRRGGRLAAGYLAIVCDELGWWLGALRQGECGVSNRLDLTLGPAQESESLLALGPRALVQSGDPRGRVWRTEAFALAPSGQPVAAAAVQFVGGPAFTRLMLPRFLRPDDREALRRAFPRYYPPPA